MQTFQLYFVFVSKMPLSRDVTTGNFVNFVFTAPRFQLYAVLSNCIKFLLSSQFHYTGVFIDYQPLNGLNRHRVLNSPARTLRVRHRVTQVPTTPTRCTTDTSLEYAPHTLRCRHPNVCTFVCSVDFVMGSCTLL